MKDEILPVLNGVVAVVAVLIASGPYWVAVSVGLIVFWLAHIYYRMGQ